MDTNGGDTMKPFWVSRKPHQGPCKCDDYGKFMQWKGIDWFITNNGYLLCSSCMLRWVKENRYHKETRKEHVAMQTLSVAA